jgi:hypothetical protein
MSDVLPPQCNPQELQRKPPRSGHPWKSNHRAEWTPLSRAADPDALAGVLGQVLAVQSAQEIAEAREADDELVAEIDWRSSPASTTGARIHVWKFVQCCMTSARSSWNPVRAVSRRASSTAR